MQSESFQQSDTDQGCLHLAYGAEELQFGDLYLPTRTEWFQPYPVVILIHGGFWRNAYRLSLMTGLAQDLARRGIAAWNIEYRSLGDSGGGWPGTLQDVARAANYLQTLAADHALDVQGVIAVGHSAGGQLAFWLAGRSHLPKDSPLASTASPLALRGAVSLAGVVDLELAWRLHLGNDAVIALLGGDPDQVPERYAAAAPTALLPLGVPQVLIHGTQDDRVPLVVSQSYVQKVISAGEQPTLIELPGIDHFALIDARSEAWEMTVREIGKLLDS